MKILVTGASGFIGRSVCWFLIQKGWQVRGTLLPNEEPSLLLCGVEPVVIEPLGATTNCEHALKDIDVVIHLAARVHVLKDTSSEILNEFSFTNTDGTICLANQAAASGVKRVVFMSTIGVNGNDSGSSAFTESDEPNPHNYYSISKHEAEIGLREISKKTGLEVVIIRSPLVYGPGVKVNFLSLMKAVSRKYPLPLASVKNRRSLIFVDNLSDALILCAIHPDAAGNTFLVSDGEDMSTPELIRRTAEALDIPARLFICPLFLLRIAGRLTGKTGEIERLTGSLTVDSSKIRRELGWTPPFSVKQGLQITAENYLGSSGVVP